MLIRLGLCAIAVMRFIVNDGHVFQGYQLTTCGLKHLAFSLASFWCFATTLKQSAATGSDVPPITAGTVFLTFALAKFSTPTM